MAFSGQRRAALMAGSGPRPIAPESLGPTLTVGEILTEIMAVEAGYGFLEPLSLIGPFPSGAPAIFVDQVARLGGAASIVATVGRDDFGTLNIERLRRDGVDVSAVAVSERLPTGTAFVRYRPDGGRDFVYGFAGSAAGEIGLDAAACAAADRAGHLHVMGSALSIPGAWEVIEFAIGSVRRRGGSVSFDPNVRKELLTSGSIGVRFAAVTEVADLLLPSGDELFVSAGVEEEGKAIASLLTRGVSEVVLKRGKAGASFFGAGGARFDRPAFAVEEVDPTGAGDCFGAAYLTCRRVGMPPERALHHAAAAGALAVTRRGPMEGAGTFADLDALAARAGTRP